MATGSAASHYTEGLMLNAGFRGSGVTYTMALFSVIPDDSGAGGTEITGGSYARQGIAFGAPATKTPTGSEIANSALITFPVATANWGTVAAWGVYDNSGNFCGAALFSPSFTVNSTQQQTFPIGSLITGCD